MRAFWLNLALVEVCWAALAYYLGETWVVRVFLFLLLKTLLVWVWRKSRAVR